MTNMIQNYANNINQGMTSVNNTTKKYYNNFTDVNAANLLQPLDGKGYLVENNLLTAPKEMAKDSYYTAKSLQKGILGKANDHELGKLNDLGLKLGGLGIATYLMTKRSTPKTKAMEFIGFGAFLASMAIWPKVALQWPAQLVHGFNFRKQYVDEQGRKKYLTQDPNYIPFDLLKGKKKSEDLGHIADKMGVSKDDKDRIEIAKEHVRKVSVQNNTLWMMTAGVATPIMTALTCAGVEKPIGKLTEKISNNKVNKLAEDIKVYMDSSAPDAKLEGRIIKLDDAAATKLDDILKAKTGQPINEHDITQISEILTTGLDTKTQKAARLDLAQMLSADKTVVNEKTVNSITELLTQKVDSRYGEGYAASIFDPKKLSEHVDNFLKSSKETESGILTPDKSEKLRLSISEFFENATSGNKALSEGRRDILDSLSYDSVDEVFSRNKAAVLTEDAAGNISKAGKIIRKFRALDETIASATHFKVEKASETIAGNNWGEVTDTLIKELKITPKELKEAKSSEELTAELFTRKLEEVAKDETRYKKLVKTVSEKMTELDAKLDNVPSRGKIPEGKQPVMDTLVNCLTRNCDKTSEELSNIGGNGQKPFSNLVQRISGESINDSFTGSLKEAKTRRIKQARVGGIQNAYMRLLHTMDFFRRAEEYNAGKGKLGFSDDPALNKELIAKGKKILMSSHSGDFFMKHETNNNVNFYKAVMWHTFGVGERANATQEVLNYDAHQVFNNGNKSNMAQRVTNWAKHINKLMGKTLYDFLPDHMTDAHDDLKNIEKTAVEKFNKIACTPDTLLYNALKQKYNSNKWMKTFTTIGGIVLAGTLATQFAFGKQDKNN